MKNKIKSILCAYGFGKQGFDGVVSGDWISNEKIN